MSYRLVTEDLREKFGEIKLEILSQKGNERVTCLRRVSDNAVLTYHPVVFHDEGVSALGQELHNQIVAGKPIGEVIKNANVLHERIVSDFSLVKMDADLKALFQTTEEECLLNTIEYRIKALPYASIIEFYNPEFIPADDIIKK